MHRLRPLDLALAAALVALWATCFALHLHTVSRGCLAWVPVAVRPDPSGGPPMVHGLWPGAADGIAEGDRLLRVDGVELSGVGELGFLARVYQTAAGRSRVPLILERDGARVESELVLLPLAFPWRITPLVIGMMVTGTLAFFRMPRSPAVRAFFFANAAYAVHWSLFFAETTAGIAAWAGLFVASATLAPPLVLRGVLWLPLETAPRSRLGRAWPWVLAVSGPASASWVFGVPLPPASGVRLASLLMLLFLASLFAVLTRNYLSASPLGRRQLKWVLVGLYLGSAPVLAGAALAALRPSLWWAYEASMIAPALVPVCLFIAIARYHLFDVDRLISGAASYTLLGILLLAGALTVAPRAAAAISATLGVEPAVGQLGVSVLLAAMLVPANRSLRPRLERLFFAERYAFESGVEALLGELAAAVDPGALLERLGSSLDDLSKPESCVIYARAGGGFEPVFVRGRAVPPAFDANGSLVPMLARAEGAVRLEPGKRRGGTRLDRADRAALAGLDAAVAIPISRRDALTAFICLGPKRSGDVYTSTELVLLSALGNKASSELAHFDDGLVLREAREMQDALRRYVPGAVAARLESGAPLEAEEREVSVLFVDIRGYTGYSESRRAEEIFSTINRYTEIVSRLVRQHGGAVVEFNGDGMMAVFGAPDRLDGKERAALAAGIAIVTAMGSLSAGGEREQLGVGVGIATGPAFVGNVRAVDRLIWTVTGNPTILAARLQALTREVEAALVIDAETARRAGALAAALTPRESVAIRGRQEPVDLYLLPLHTPATTA